MAKRKITNNIILVPEAIHTSKAKGDKGMIINIDVTNTFDRVRHSFFFDVLHWFGLSGNFIW